LSFFLLSCQNESQEVNLDVEKQQIKKLTQQWLKAESNKNLDSSLTFIAKDGIYLANDRPTLRGHEEISTFLKAAFEMPLDTIIGDPEKLKFQRLVTWLMKLVVLRYHITFQKVIPFSKLSIW